MLQRKPKRIRRERENVCVCVDGAFVLIRLKDDDSDLVCFGCVFFYFSVFLLLRYLTRIVMAEGEISSIKITRNLLSDL